MGLSLLLEPDCCVVAALMEEPRLVPEPSPGASGWPCLLLWTEKAANPEAPLPRGPQPWRLRAAGAAVGAGALQHGGLKLTVVSMPRHRGPARPPLGVAGVG